MGLERTSPTMKWGVSLNEEEWEIEDDLESAIYKGLEMAQDSLWIGPGQSQTVPIWIGPASRYQAEWFLLEALTGWNDWEERSNEIFYDETLCEWPNPLNFPEGQRRTEWMLWLEDKLSEMCSEFGIECNYYNIETSAKVDVEAWWAEEDDTPKCKAKFDDDIYETD